MRLFNFRNYADETVEFAPGLNLITGANAQGKTNLLEGVATVALTRSPRAAAAADVITWEQEQCRLDARLGTATGPQQVDLRLRRGERGTAVRTLSVDGAPRGARALLGTCPVVLFWPEDLLLVRGAPEGRRRLLDTLLSQLDARSADDLVRYRRVLEQRNALLRQHRTGGGSLQGLSSFTRALAEHGGAIRVARQRLVQQLAPLAAAALAELSGGAEQLQLQYRHGEESNADTPVERDDAVAQLEAELEARRAEELVRGVTVAGPHRDDLGLELDGHPARAAASQGQQRSIVLAIKLAELRHLTMVTGMAPVLVLDDVLSELDAARRGRLLSLLGAGHTSQALISTSEPDVLQSGDPAHRLRVERGRVHVEERSA